MIITGKLKIIINKKDNADITLTIDEFRYILININNLHLFSMIN